MILRYKTNQPRCLLVLLAALCAGPAAGANANRVDADKPGGSDHPLISRYAGSTLYTYGDDNVGTAPMLEPGKGRPVEQIIEGKVATRAYWGPAGRSALEVFRNYQSALRNAGFQPVYECEVARCEADKVQHILVRWPIAARWVGNDKSDYHVIRMFEYKPGFHYIHARKSGPHGPVDVQVALREGDAGNKGTADKVLQYVQVVEAATVEQGKVTVDAAAIGSALKREGRIALYGVLFDTSQAAIKPESGATLEQMAKTLKDDPQLQVLIVGHTDNQGAIDANLALSRKRAQAVVERLTGRYGIAPARLQAHGVANLSPTSSNSDDAGRARNRRVEMVVR
ncbi:OmpA family protein [Massilia genomosp. 1]|uniref:OmpA family protein n=1 Tax=Massilia genomosp. 1 TaxID=2609280 RepID=A0ABX0MGH3_9BURK|nr:OmpA family protein [Massilia genomosp. 1]